ncbi:lipid droplet-regulating VLDL assembly factor AUP1-like [Sycon ciliatum]|uniref:lipid droplet-regulating VLDL assembly factor AUP1-like n=1 Tax=Sycon ciliatum TaxID=27933 RepID=UPI0031F60D7E
MSTASVDISSLYHRRRLLDTSLVWTFGLLLYTPFGIVLAVLRLLLFLQLWLFLRVAPKSLPLRRWWFRGVQPGLGLVVTSEGFGAEEEQSSKVLVANHVTLLDHCIVESLLPCVAVIEPSRCPVMHNTMGHGPYAVSEGPVPLTERLQNHLQDTSSLPVLTHPENGVNTGTALMAFKQWPFSVQSSVRPIVITSWRPFPIAPHYFHSSIIPDLFFFLFVPFTAFHVRALPTITKEGAESDEEFSSRVQKVMANALSVPVCQHTRRDFVDHVKREAQNQSSRASAERQPSQRQSGTMSVYDAMPGLSSNERMVQQVQEVFPHAPYDIVARDLATSQSVDTTISNILEGRLNIDVPAQPTRAAPAATPKKSSASPAKSSRMKATKILSFQEQKQQLILASRARYLKRAAGQQ